jgi:hypothetical protein
VPTPKDKQVDRYAPKASDSPAVAAWRQRMASAEAKAIYKERAATAECVNAQARNRGLLQLPVRGQLKDTLVLFGGEFGRQPIGQSSDGRDHQVDGFTIWRAAISATSAIIHRARPGSWGGIVPR